MVSIDVIEKKLSPVLQSYGVRRALVFGSVAKGESTDRSDVDLYVDSGLRGMKFIGLIEDMKGALGGGDIDVLDAAHVEAGSEVEKEISAHGVVIYER